MFAQSPQGVGYQGVATDLNGVELINQTISIQASVLSSSATGNIEWQEQHSVTTDAFGLFTLTIGQGTSTGNGAQANFADISWGSATHFLKIEMDVNAGTNYSHIGTNQMMSVPYALYAENANINYDSIATILSNDSSFANSIIMGGGGSNVSIQCVDMGVSILCGGLGLDSSASLLPNQNDYYSYSISRDWGLNSNNYYDQPHWRKFEVIGLSSDYVVGADLVFKYTGGSNHSGPNYNSTYSLTPEIVNGRVYFYMYASNEDQCNTQANIGLSIPLTHSWNVDYYNAGQGGGYTSWNHSDFKLYYPTQNSLKNSGVFFSQ